MMSIQNNTFIMLFKNKTFDQNDTVGRIELNSVPL